MFSHFVYCMWLYIFKFLVKGVNTEINCSDGVAYGVDSDLAAQWIWLFLSTLIKVNTVCKGLSARISWLNTVFEYLDLCSDKNAFK